MRNRGWLFPLRLATMVVALGTVTLAAGSALPGVEAPSTAAADDAPANQHTCSGGTKTPDPFPLIPPVVQTCTVTSASGYCIQRSTAPAVVQTCTFTQTSPTGRKTGYAIQEARASGAQGTQDAEQVITVTQSNTGPSGSASFTYTQRVDQEQNAGSGGGDDDDDGPSGPPAASIDQEQQSHQSVDITQTTAAGSIVATGVQTLGQEQRAANAVDIQQRQNAFAESNDCGPAVPPNLDLFDDPLANQCATFRQTSTTGSLRATPDQRYTQFQRATDASTGKQVQGVEFDPTSGGLDLRFAQSSAGVALWDSEQDENQTQQRNNTGTMTFEQHGPVRKGSGSQASNTNDLTRIDQSSTQFSGECAGGDDGDDDDEGGGCVPAGVGEQTNVLTAMATTTGECIANLNVQQNEESESATEPGNEPPPGDTCDEFIVCGDISTIPGDIGSFLLALPPAILEYEVDNCTSSDVDID